MPPPPHPSAQKKRAQSYRTREEMAQWRARDPVVRFRNWLGAQGWWDEAREVELRRALRAEVVGALEAASKVSKPPLSDMFSDVYAGPELPWHLAEQCDAALAFARRHPGLVPAEMPVR
jgi:2-oxoisovalerate dehydrogenase E1 component alpha subunit